MVRVHWTRVQWITFCRIGIKQLFLILIITHDLNPLLESRFDVGFEV